MNRTPALPLLTIAALALAGCGAEDSDQERIEELEAQVEELQGEDQGEASEDYDAEGEPPGDADLVEDVDADMEPVEVGDDFELFDPSNYAGPITVTYDAFVWMNPERVEGEANYGVAILSVTNDSSEPVGMPAPIEGGGWHYLEEDGNIESTYRQGIDWDTTYSGRLGSWHSGPYTPGTTESGLTLATIPDSRGGTLVFMSPDGFMDAELAVPDESVNEDHETIQEMYRIADDMFDGEVASAY